jgi:hypothetical protein
MKSELSRSIESSFYGLYPIQCFMHLSIRRPFWRSFRFLRFPWVRCASWGCAFSFFRLTCWFFLWAVSFPCWKCPSLRVVIGPIPSTLMFGACRQIFSVRTNESIALWWWSIALTTALVDVWGFSSAELFRSVWLTFCWIRTWLMPVCFRYLPASY